MLDMILRTVYDRISNPVFCQYCMVFLERHGRLFSFSWHDYILYFYAMFAWKSTCICGYKTLTASWWSFPV